MVKVAALLVTLPAVASAACISSGDHSTINNALRSGGAGAVVQLCENALIKITDQISFTADDQEISTQNYPTGNTRATIQVAPGSATNTLIAGRFNRIKIKNVQLDGNRAGAGFHQEGGANIEIGGQSTGQVVSNVASRNPRGWSCLHVIGSGNDGSPCKQATIVNNDIGPCGQSGYNDQGQGLWADGISLDCTDSLVQGNTINGPTDGGIVIFGSPGSTINNNTIVSSPDYLGFGAINMVDGQYQGSYAGVKVTNNKIQGNKIFNLGIGIGANVWSFNDPYALHGPAEITGNSISGHVVFPIAVNGWTGGITVTGNDASGATKPKSSFSDASHCVGPIQEVFNQNANFVYFPAGVTGSKNLQPEFAASSGNMTNFLCSSLPLADAKTFQKSQLDVVSDSGPFADLHGVVAQYQGDSNVVVLQGGKPVWASGHTLSQGCGKPSGCRLRFGADGNLGTYYNNALQWSSNTGGRGSTMVVMNKAPWIQIKDGSGNVIWDTTKSS
ncbi:hypothetical protein LMH87_006864 [Akanthomyces muscarius]|uniref:Bulb-type lectin domain-containing protein n=1 Tax=Akanthomyces muscarius TaxID=2231603 RepID=A0A9W8QPL4_AKAMU|nr:hypothetical protein LMH87_006864 [Akanthomyces muscarius]KAJ4165223.1 hypothetical protein LMH87_006864 [Akanthomyces muscarius]